MLLPLGTDIRLRRPTLITFVLMAISVFVFAGQQIADGRTPPSEPRVYENLVLYAQDFSDENWGRVLEDVNDGADAVVNPGRWYQFVTYQFLHGSWLHLIGNMIFLLVFGPPVEDKLRRGGFLAFYLAGGVAAGLVHGLFESVPYGAGDSTLRMIMPVIGASGSIAAVTGAYLVLFPLAPVRLLTFFGVFALPGWLFVVLSIAFDMFFIAGGKQGVAYFAHLGGYAAGAGVVMALLWLKVLPRDTYELFTILRQKYRRRAYEAAISAQRASSPFLGDVGKQGVLSGKEEAYAERARTIAQQVSVDAEAASAAYIELVSESEKAVLARDAQIAVAAALYAKGDFQNAADAYERFLDRYPSDREADQTRLMLALILTRKLNDPVGAVRLLESIDESALSEDFRTLKSTLREELA